MPSAVTRADEDAMAAILHAVTAYRAGDFGVRLPADWTGLEGKVADALNEVIATNQWIRHELGRLREVVGKQGRITQRLSVGGARGEWAECMHAVHDLVEDLARPTNEIARVIEAAAHGDLSQTVPTEVDGRPLQGQFANIATTVNTMVRQLSSFAMEVTRVAHEVGTEGRLGGQATVRGVGGVWKDLTDSVNVMAANLTAQVRNIAEVTTAVANGDLSKKITVEGRGEILELKNTVNVMVDQLNSFAGEVTRVAREVGTEGRLGGQANVRGVGGVWKDLTDNVNRLAGQLTTQIRNIAEVTTAVAGGDLSKKVTVDVQGEILELKDTINVMIDTLATFADHVTTVAREVGVEGRLGGQASVPGAAGTWKHLTDNVNQLASTLTDQIRAIADVATAVTQGDLTRSITVGASGEVAVLKDKLNEMIRNLRLTTQRNTEQDWLKTNLARFSGMLQGQHNLDDVSLLIMSELAPLLGAQHGAFYVVDATDAAAPVLRFQAGYAAGGRDRPPQVLRMGEGLVGQCALDRKPIRVADAPARYVSSGLAEAPPLSVVVLPVLFEGQIKAVIELASFQQFSATHLDFLDRLMESIGIVLNTIEANMRTEKLLRQSQSLAQELQAQQAELRRTNDELEVKARQLAEQNAEVERKNREVEESRRSLQEKAEQLALTSKYKSEFLANMSHELRTPLNSLLVLAEQLAANAPGNLNPKQVEFARLIRSSGQDLLGLINDILDLSKIESGTVALDLGDLALSALRAAMEREFRHVADARGLAFEIVLEPGLPDRMRTDAKRLQQVLRNLIANAFKFTERGRVTLRVRSADSGWDPDVASLGAAPRVIAFDIEDTGVGIPEDKQRLIFEAFQQAEGSTSRTYGGTGLGLSISRELVRLLGGQITLRSAPGEGSTFTVYLPLEAAEPASDDEAAVEAAARRPPLTPVRPPTPAVEDDRGHLGPGDPSVLIVEDDPNFAQILLDLAHQSGFKGVVALGGSEALDLARHQLPTAITLDIGLADMSGWKVLDTLKWDPKTADVPVHVVTVFDDNGPMAREKGAASFLAKPADKESLDALFARIRTLAQSGRRGLLVVDDDALTRRLVVEATQHLGVVAYEAGSAAEAIGALRRRPIACLVLDLLLPDMSGFELLRKLQRNREWRKLPVIAYTGAELNARQRQLLRRRTAALVEKGGPRPVQRLTEQIGRFLATQRASLHAPSPGEPSEGTDQGDRDAERPPFPGRRVLVVDDDVRTLFAMTALLEDWGMRVSTAESGDEALEVLRRGPAPEVALVDVMMPEKDGYQTIRDMRRIPGCRELPIVAVTAKAMPGDEERCLEAGANAYVPKPIEVGRLRERLAEQLPAEQLPAEEDARR
jgi:signal transduction histidine kinase/CheY-like chemotaxis protein/HAMP domain-containing protein